MRPANIVTAISDVLAGVAIAYAMFIAFPVAPHLNWTGIIFLILSTSFLYGGGVVMNDVFDTDLDKLERPERPIPSGLIKKSSASFFGISLIVLGVLCAILVSPSLQSLSWVIAIIIGAAALIYDKWAKHHAFFGPLTMGLCRGLNLLLGMSIITIAVHAFVYLALVPLLYIFAITMISRGEVHGGKRTTLYVAAALYLLVILTILYISFTEDTLLFTLPFIVFFSLMIFLPLQKAIIKPEGPRIGKAVKAGVISLIIMNASWAAAVDNLVLAAIIIALLPISLLLARLFAVT
ncbi:MAG: UbiA-like protein EboC [Chitinophagaceae bacterium]|nr:UbiA-like protein EboC [Chitinophagaceae bacterium]